MAVFTKTREAPTLADATAAAEALVAAGAEEVLLFGSLARGEAHEHSDIDLVAVFADIDYARRVDLKCRMEETAAAAAGEWPVQVLVTDRPEWARRVEKVSTSLECRINPEAVRVAEAATRGYVRWNKEMVKPMSDPDQALQDFSDRVLNRLAELSDSVTPRFDEDSIWLTAADREIARLRRMVSVCKDSAVAVELALKVLAVLYGIPTPSEKELRSAGHDIDKCLSLVPEPARSAVEGAVRELGLDLPTMSRWRIVATYPGDADVERADADRLVEDYVTTALTVCGLVMDSIQQTVADSPAMRAAHEDWSRVSALIKGRNVRTGRTRDDT